MWGYILHQSQLHFHIMECNEGIPHGCIIEIQGHLHDLTLQLAALHFNENREQAVTKQGEHQHNIVFPNIKEENT